MPYLNFYLDQIDRTHHEVHLLYWNRDLQEEDLRHLAGVTLHEFRLYQEDDVPQIKKIQSFAQYRKFANQIIKEKYDFVIALHTFPAFLMCDKLCSEYKNRFIFDYRDKTYENISLFKRIVHKLVKASYATFVSSNAFRQLLPASEEKKIYTSHNFLPVDIEARVSICHKPASNGKIRIAFWGITRNEELNRELIRKIAADDRFELHYYGREQKTALNLKEYVSSIEANNVFFHGAYEPNERYLFAAQSDIIHNMYCDGNMMLAVANKYYDGMIFYLPQLCVQGSYMGTLVENSGIGIQVDPYDDNFLDHVFQSYHTMDRAQFRKNCDLLLENVVEQHRCACDVIQKAIYC